MRSINYQLSNLRHLQEGWTVRPSTPLDFDDMFADEDSEFNLFVSAAAANAFSSSSNLVILFLFYAS
jgi:hypothetical protein